MTTATIESHEQDDEVRIFVAGEIDLANADHTEAKLDAAIDNRCQKVTLDLSELTYVDSAGLRIVASIASRLRRSQIELVIVAPHGSPARRVLELTGMTTIATFEPPDSPR